MCILWVCRCEWHRLYTMQWDCSVWPDDGSCVYVPLLRLRLRLPCNLHIQHIVVSRAQWFFYIFFRFLDFQFRFIFVGVLLFSLALSFSVHYVFHKLGVKRTIEMDCIHSKHTYTHTELPNVRTNHIYIYAHTITHYTVQLPFLFINLLSPGIPNAHRPLYEPLYVYIEIYAKSDLPTGSFVRCWVFFNSSLVYIWIFAMSDCKLIGYMCMYPTLYNVGTYKEENAVFWWR